MNCHIYIAVQRKRGENIAKYYCWTHTA